MTARHLIAPHNPLIHKVLPSKNASNVTLNAVLCRPFAQRGSRYEPQLLRCRVLHEFTAGEFSAQGTARKVEHVEQKKKNADHNIQVPRRQLLQRATSNSNTSAQQNSACANVLSQLLFLESNLDVCIQQTHVIRVLHTLCAILY